MAKFLSGVSADADPHYHKLCSRVSHIWGNRKGQPNRSAMEGPRPGGTSLLIKVSPEPGKYTEVMWLLPNQFHWNRLHCHLKFCQRSDVVSKKRMLLIQSPVEQNLMIITMYEYWNIVCFWYQQWILPYQGGFSWSMLLLTIVFQKYANWFRTSLLKTIDH